MLMQDPIYLDRDEIITVGDEFFNNEMTTRLIRRDHNLLYTRREISKLLKDYADHGDMGLLSLAVVKSVVHHQEEFCTFVYRWFRN